MAITLKYGTPSSGKTLSTVKEMLDCMKRGQRVIANFKITPPHRYVKKGRVPKYWTNDQITVDRLERFALKYHTKDADGDINAEHQTLVVIDECHLLYGKDFLDDKEVKARWAYFFTQHAKFGYDFVLITQGDKILDPNIRTCVETEKVFFSVNNCPSRSILFMLFWTFCKLIGIKLFFYVEQWYHFKNPLFANRKFFMFRKKYRRIYNRFKRFDTASNTSELLSGLAESGAVSGARQGRREAEDIAAQIVSDALVNSSMEASEWGVRVHEPHE